MEKRRGPARLACDSKQRLVAATCALLAQRGFEATTPQMFQQAPGWVTGACITAARARRRKGSRATRSAMRAQTRSRS